MTANFQYALSAVLAVSVILWKSLAPLYEEQLGNVAEVIGRKALAGTRVDMGRLQLFIGASSGVALNNLKVFNTEGWRSEYLMELDKVLAHVNTGKAVATKGKVIEISEVQVKGLRLTFERSLCSSNIKALLRLMSNGKKKETKKPKRLKAAKDDQHTGPEVAVRKIRITGVQVEMTTYAQKKYGISGAVLRLGDIVFDDFSRQSGITRVDVLVTLLVESILRSVLASAANLAKLGADGALEGGKLALDAGAKGAGAALDVGRYGAGAALDIGKYGARMTDSLARGAGQLGSNIMQSAGELGGEPKKSSSETP